MSKKSQYKGVTWYEPYKKWVAYVYYKRKRYYAGYFEDEIEAAKAYNKKALEIKGDKAKLNFEPEKVCEACGEKALYFYKNSMYLCKRHISQMNRLGKILKRTKNDVNEILIYDNFAEIILYDIKSEEVGRAVIDISDINKIKNNKWYLREDGYVATNNYNEEYQFLHCAILGIKPDDCVIDHIDRNRLNNHKSNLRIANYSENGANKGIRIDNTSGKVGVHWAKEQNKWCSMIGFNNKRKNLGYFNNYDDAVKARLIAEEKYFKDFKPLNEKEYIINDK